MDAREQISNCARILSEVNRVEARVPIAEEDFARYGHEQMDDTARRKLGETLARVIEERVAPHVGFERVPDPWRPAEVYSISFHVMTLEQMRELTDELRTLRQMLDMPVQSFVGE